MVVYVEYVLLENMLLDSMLLYLSMRAVKVQSSIKRLFFCAFLGGIFALLFPVSGLKDACKFPLGFSLVLLCFPWRNCQKRYKKSVSACVWFLVFSFVFGGVLTALHGYFFFTLTPIFTVCGFFILSLIAVVFIKKIYQKRAVAKYLYDCEIIVNERKKNVLGYLDSGNLAQKGELPVCFLSPDVFYELFIENSIGQVCDEMKISTVSGEKRIRLYKGEIKIENVQKAVYFSLSKNMLSKEYKLLINAGIFD